MSFISELKQTGNEEDYEYILCETLPIGNSEECSQGRRERSAVLDVCSFLFPNLSYFSTPENGGLCHSETSVISTVRTTNSLSTQKLQCSAEQRRMKHSVIGTIARP